MSNDESITCPLYGGDGVIIDDRVVSTPISTYIEPTSVVCPDCGGTGERPMLEPGTSIASLLATNQSLRTESTSQQNTIAALRTDIAWLLERCSDNLAAGDRERLCRVGAANENNSSMNWHL